jgi:hypothetical protein
MSQALASSHPLARESGRGSRASPLQCETASLHGLDYAADLVVGVGELGGVNVGLLDEQLLLFRRACRGTTSGAATRAIRITPSAGPGPSTRRSSGPSRSRPSSAGRKTAWRSPGRRRSRTRAASAGNSTMSWISCRSSKRRCAKPR